MWPFRREKAIPRGVVQYMVMAAYQEAVQQHREWDFDEAKLYLMDFVYTGMNGQRLKRQDKKLVSQLVDGYANMLVRGRPI